MQLSFLEYAIDASFIFVAAMALSGGITGLMLMTETKEGRRIWNVLFGRRKNMFKNGSDESGLKYRELTTFSLRKTVLSFGSAYLIAYAIWYYFGPEWGVIATGLASGFILAAMQAMLFAWVENERENEENFAGIPADEPSDDK